jgi:hypothetical protein
MNTHTTSGPKTRTYKGPVGASTRKRELASDGRFVRGHEGDTSDRRAETVTRLGFEGTADRRGLLAIFAVVALAFGCNPPWKEYRASEFGIAFRVPAPAKQVSQYYPYPFGRTEVTFWSGHVRWPLLPLGDYPRGFLVYCYRLEDQGGGLPRPDEVFEAERRRALDYPGASLAEDHLAKLGKTPARELRVRISSGGKTSTLVRRIAVVGRTVVAMSVHARVFEREQEEEAETQFFASLVVDKPR